MTHYSERCIIIYNIGKQRISLNATRETYLYMYQLQSKSFIIRIERIWHVQQLLQEEASSVIDSTAAPLPYPNYARFRCKTNLDTSVQHIIFN